MIRINNSLSIPANEISFTFTRAGGPGGQNVNKVNSKVTLWFDVDNSSSLSGHQKIRIKQRLAGRINKEGALQVSSMQFRTQKANREDVLRRFISLLSAALKEKPRRKKTRIPRKAKEARLRAKKRRGQLKAVRSKQDW